MKRDTIHYQVFKRFPGLLFELVNNPPPQSRNYRFDSVEVKETSFRIDGVFLPPLGAVPKTVFFAEVQFQKDESLYHRFFTESLAYLYRNQSLYDDWRGVVIFPSRSLEPLKTTMHRSLLRSDQVQRIYLNELEDSQHSLGISLMQLPLASEAHMADQAKQLIARVQQEQTASLAKSEIIDVITTIAVYKFSKLTRAEVEAMLGLRLEETRVYQDAKAEGEQIGEQRGEQRGERNAKLKMVSRLVAKGLSLEEVAELLEMSVEDVRQAAQQ